MSGAANLSGVADPDKSAESTCSQSPQSSHIPLHNHLPVLHSLAANFNSATMTPDSTHLGHFCSLVSVDMLLAEEMLVLKFAV